VVCRNLGYGVSTHHEEGTAVANLKQIMAVCLAGQAMSQYPILCAGLTGAALMPGLF